MFTYYGSGMATGTPTTGDNVAAEMKRHRMSQQRLADHLHLSQAAVSARLRGVVDWRLAELQTVADLFGVTVADLIASTAREAAAVTEAAAS